MDSQNANTNTTIGTHTSIAPNVTTSRSPSCSGRRFRRLLFAASRPDDTPGLHEADRASRHRVRSAGLGLVVGRGSLGVTACDQSLRKLPREVWTIPADGTS